MSAANLQPINFSKTQRIVLLIDLQPILTLQNPSHYLSAVTAAVERLLRFPPLSAALSAFKFFFSSLSPLRSATVLPRHLCTPSLSFDLAPQTLASLSTTLNSISNLTDLPNVPSSVRASNAASSLLQLIHDYAWETEKDNMLGEGTLTNVDFMRIPSNLVILISPISRSVNCLVDYLELREFGDVFRIVRGAFVVRDMHLCWVDVKSDPFEFEGENEKRNECGNELATLMDGIRKMGWGFCSSDLIVLGSALLPLGLIYPKIGMSLDFVDFGGLDKKKHSGELSLEILDVNGITLEYSCCNLEIVNLKSLPCTIETYDIWNAEESRDSQSLRGKDAFSVRLGKGNVKVHVKSVQRYDRWEKIGGLSEIALVREGFQESGKNRKKSEDVFFADRVVDMLHGEMGGVTWTNQIPTWQMFLSFLHTKGYWALVSLSSSNGDTLMGSMKPFTAHLAILYISDAGHGLIRDKSGSNGKTRETCFENMNDSNSCCGSQTDTSTSGNYEKYGDGKRKRSQRQLYKEMTWSSLCKAAFEGSNFDLFELYVAKYLEKSKKLKFLKCWMKQIIKVDQCFLTTLSGPKSVEEIFACNELSSEQSPVKETAIPVSKSETSETFFNNLSNRIQHGLESGMDLQNLAERVVKSSIHWLHHNCEDKNNSEGQESIRNSNDSCSEAVGEKLIKLLLRAPKEMKKIQQDSSSEHAVREYEMQILLRLEIMRSYISATMRESRKQKLLKQICSLLEILQYLVAGGIHGHVSLYDYVERTIRSRYSDELEDVVKEIYTRMDLLPFGDNDEAPNLLFNSDDSNQSWRDKHDRNENNSVSNEGESSQPLADAFKETEKDEHTRILNEARERRERARRFAPFISKARDLQRVWAPKHPKSTKCKFDSIPKKSKRKDRQTPSCTVVYETPLTEDKRACLREKNNRGDKENSVSKALFQDNR